MKFLLLVFLMTVTLATVSVESICHGTSSSGRLENGVKLPSNGKNFVSYGTIPALAGRTYVHSKVRTVIVEACRMLEAEQSEKVFKYAETGFKEGGEFKPHKTHHNGLSVDFMVPVVNEIGKSVHLPTNPLNNYGYAIEFDEKGHYDGYRIDYEAMGAHIVALHKAARNHEIDIWRVVFDPRLQPYLYKTRYGGYLERNLHHEHYHVDFVVECKLIEG